LNIFLGGNNKSSVGHESDFLELEDESHLLFQEKEMNLEDGVSNRLNLKVPVWKESFEQLHEHRLDSKQSKAQSVNEILVNLHCLALDPFYLVGNCLNTVRLNVLRFRSFSFQNISDISLKKCLHPKSTEAHFSHPGYIEAELGVKVDIKQSCGEIVCPSVSYMDAPVNCLGKKRKLDQPSVSCRSLKLQKNMQFSSTTGTNAYLQINKAECKANSSDALFPGPPLSDHSFKLCMPMPLFPLNGSDSYLRRKHSSGFKVDLVNAGFPFPLVKLEMKHHSSIEPQSLTYLCDSNLMDLVQNMFNNSLLGGASHRHHGDIVETGKLQEPAENIDILNDSRACISSVKRQEPGKSFCIWEDHGSCMSYVGIRDEDVKVDCNLSLLQPFATQSVFNHVIGTLANVIKVDHSLAAKKWPSQSDVTADKIKMLPSDGDGATSIRPNKEASVNVAFGDSSKEHKELYKPVASDSSFKLQRGQQLEGLVTIADSTSLHMKFPKDFKLPSKEELVQKFSPFGTVNSLRTKIFYNTSAAKVVFLHPTDAMAAYQYTKKERVLFGEANIRFWLDPLEHKRRGTEFSSPPPSLKWKPVNLKKCQLVTSDLSFKSKRGQQLEALATTAASTSLHMKFPKDFELPSKQELVKKFSPFGKIDSFRTKVSSYTGAAQVVFLHPIDAVAAYQYAKKKRVLFGGANMRFWLDPLEHKRRGTKFSVSSPSLTEKQMNLKSCLKKSSPLECRDKKKPHKVRFIIET
jgi:hypothetical protein